MEVVKKPKKAKVKKEMKTEQREKSPKEVPFAKGIEEATLADVIVNAGKDEVKKVEHQQQKPEAVKMQQKKRIKNTDADIKNIKDKLEK
jgi:hypothetical protein